MSHADGTQREKRWAIIAEDGNHSWLGRHSDPSIAEIAVAADSLGRAGITAWLAVTEGTYYDPAHTMTVIQVRLLHGAGDFDVAVKAFLDRRRRTLGHAC